MQYGAITVLVELIIVLQGIIGVRIGSYNSIELTLSKSADVLLDQHLEQTLLTHTSYVITSIALGIVQDAKVQASLLEYFGREEGSFGQSGVIRGVISYKPEIIDRFSARILDPPF